jgi:TonB-linked SusC/RagA family outer membrane protein
MKKLQLVLLLLTSAVMMMAQDRKITGVVLDGELNGEPLIGAAVGVGEKTVRSGTVTDFNGNFSITVPETTKTLKVSYVGYDTQTVTLKPGQNHYKITLTAEGNSINEVVVTGYQNIDRRKLTAAVSEVKITDEALGNIKTIDQALSGQIAGVSAVTANGAPGAPIKIRIRGTSTLNGVAEPLWVLDGMPMNSDGVPAISELKEIDDLYQTSIAGLNPADIDNITVLKDAAATAIYGARAANGVIVITTKKGREGKPVVNFSTKLTVSPKRSIDRLNLLNSDEKVGLELDLLRTPYNYREQKGGVSEILNELGEMQAYKNGGWDALSEAAQQRINRLRGINTDWNDLLLRSAFNQEYNASISGGSDRMRYYGALGYYNEKGLVKGVDHNRYNLTLKLTDIKLHDRFKIGVSLYANQRRQDSFLNDTGGFTNPINYARMVSPYIEPYDANGNYIYDGNVQGKESEVANFNMLEEMANTSKERKDRSVMALFDAQWRILDNLKLSSQFGYQYDNYSLEKYAGAESYNMRKEKAYAQYTIDGVKKCILPDGGRIENTDSHSNQWTWKAMLEWNKRFNEIHDVELMAGTEVRKNETKTVYSRAYGYDRRTLTTQPVLFPTETIANQYPLYKETHTESAFVSWYTTGSYTLMHRYTFGFSLRFDGSDAFGVAKENRYLPLYSFSGLWRAKEESFLKDAEWLSELNLRASYGLQGNIDKTTSPYLIGRFDRKSVLGGTPETIIDASQAPNPDLKWETTKNVNIGVDFSVLKNRIRMTVDYYWRKSTDLLSTRKLPLETGFAYTSVNWASMKNTGWEIAIYSKNISTPKFTWTTNLNLGFNSNEVLQETVAENSTYPSRVGHPVGALFAYETAGIDSDGYPLFRAKDGTVQTAKEFFKLNSHGASELTAAEQRELYSYAGSTEPKCTGGFNNTFEYGAWSLGINFIFNYGEKVRIQPSYSMTSYDRGLNTNHDILNRWTPTNTSSALPGLVASTPERASEYIRFNEYLTTYNNLDTWIKDRNYWRLQSLRLGYKVPKDWLHKFGISSATVSLEGRNLMAFGSNYDNFLDPETLGNPYAQPIAKSIIFGLNVNF